MRGAVARVARMNRRTVPFSSGRYVLLFYAEIVMIYWGGRRRNLKSLTRLLAGVGAAGAKLSRVSSCSRSGPATFSNCFLTNLQCRQSNQRSESCLEWTSRLYGLLGVGGCVDCTPTTPRPAPRPQLPTHYLQAAAIDLNRPSLALILVVLKVSLL